MPTSRPLPASCRRGISLAELLVASTVMSLIAGGMGTLALTMQTANEHCRGQGIAAQHGRMLCGRVQAAVEGATASESFPGCVAFSESVGSYTFPDTLVVWKPTLVAASPTGLPKVSELLVFCPHPTQPQRFLEIRDPGNNNTVPALSNATSWRTLLASLKSTSNTAQRTELSNLVRTANASNTSTTGLRGCVRFNIGLAPTAAQFASYRSGLVAWENLDWPLDLYGSQAGVRQVTCQFEIQLDATAATSSQSPQASVPCFGSATLVHSLNK